MLTAIQRETQRLIRRTLGDAMAQRYEDWCDVIGGTVRLRVPGPVIGHLAREFESMLRAALKTPFEVETEIPQDAGDKLDAAKSALEGLGYDEARVRNAVVKLTPDTHSHEISAICMRIGLPVDGEVNHAWRELMSQAGRAHWRSYWESSSVAAHTAAIDSFELVMRQVLTALERHYDAFFQRIDRLCTLTNATEAVKIFAKNIPLSAILQQRFYLGAPVSPQWIAAMRTQRLFTDRPLQFDSESEEAQATYAPWFQGIYLKKVGESDDPAVRRQASEIVRELVRTDDIGILASCAQAITALPANDAAPFADTFVTWLKRRVAWPVRYQAAEFIKKMSGEDIAPPAFLVARALFDLDKGEHGRVTAQFDPTMYAHYVKLGGRQLIHLNAPLAFDLFIELLAKSLEVCGLIDRDGGHDHSVSGYGGLIGPGPTGYDEPDALSEVAKEAAIEASMSSAEAGPVIARLREFRIRLMDQIALDLALRTVAQVPGTADDMLRDPRLMGGYWCQSRYAALARARLPVAAPELVDAVLRLANSMPDRFEENWLANRRAVGQAKPTETELADYRATTVLNVLFQFKDVLPATVRDDIDRSTERYRVEPHVATASSSTNSAAEEGKPIPFPPSSTAALFEEAKGQPEAFFAEGRLDDIPIGNLWVVFEGLKEAQSRGVPIVWDVIVSWMENVLPEENEWGKPDCGQELRAALVAALHLIVANLERRDPAGSALPYVRLATFVLRLWKFPLDAPASEAPWHKVDPAGESFRTVAGLSLLIAFRLVFIETETASADAGFTSSTYRPLLLERMSALIVDPNPTANLCRGQMGMWFSNLLDREPNWTIQQMPALFGDADPVEIRPAWYGYVRHAGSSTAAVRALEPKYRAAIGSVGEKEPADWGDQRPSYQLGYRLIREFMLGNIDIDEDGLLSSFLKRANDELRARLVWLLSRWIGGPDVEPVIITRGVRYSEARLAIAEASNEVDDLKKEFAAFSTWLEAPKLDAAWLIATLGRVGDLGLLGFGVFSAFRWLEKICKEHPDAALKTASRIALHYNADGQAIYASSDKIRSVLDAAVSRGSPETVTGAVQLANALEVRGFSGMYDHVIALLPRSSNKAV